MYNRHTTAKQPAETVEASQDAEQGGTQTSSSMNAPTLSEVKDTENSETESEKQEKISDTAEVPMESAEERTEEETPKETTETPSQKPKPKKPTAFQKQLDAVGEPRTLEEAILLDIARGGAKFRWGNRDEDKMVKKRGIGYLWHYDSPPSIMVYYNLEFKLPWAITTRDWPEQFSITVPILHLHSVSLPFQLSYGVKFLLQES